MVVMDGGLVGGFLCIQGESLLHPVCFWLGGGGEELKVLSVVL